MAKKINQTALDELMGALAPSAPEQEEHSDSQVFTGSTASQPSSTPVKRGRPQKNKENICTTVSAENMSKLRAIAKNELIPLTELVDLGLTLVIRQYESKHGPIILKEQKKGSIDEVFGM